MTVTVCPTTGFLYDDEHRGDVRKANLLRKKALAALVAYPWLALSYGQREAAKASGRLEDVIRAHFARSLDAAGYDLAAHASFSEYAAAYLHNATDRYPRDQISRLARELGVSPAPHPRLAPGSSYWS